MQTGSAYPSYMVAAAGSTSPTSPDATGLPVPPSPAGSADSAAVTRQFQGAFAPGGVLADDGEFKNTGQARDATALLQPGETPSPGVVRPESPAAGAAGTLPPGMAGPSAPFVVHYGSPPNDPRDNEAENAEKILQLQKMREV